MPKTIYRREEVQRLAAEGAQVVDVLPHEDYEEAHLPGAISLPLKELTPERAEELLRKDRLIIVYCYDTQ